MQYGRSALFAGGLDVQGKASNETWEFDFFTSEWSQLTNLPVGLPNAAAAVTPADGQQQGGAAAKQTPVQVVLFGGLIDGVASQGTFVFFPAEKPNLAPAVSGLPEVVFPEDSLFTLALDPFVTDPDHTPETMTWSAAVLSTGESLTATVEEATRIATFSGAPDFNTDAPLSVVLTATDPGGLSSSDTLAVTITPVNDAPGAFQRLLPEEGATVEPDAVHFAWSAALDVDGDTLTYTLALTVAAVDSSITTQDTTLTIDFLGLGVSAGSVTWSVAASDGVLSTQAGNGAGAFTLDAGTGVATEDEAEVPEAFALHPAYPNPFNPTTTLRYDVPAASRVRLEVSRWAGAWRAWWRGARARAGIR